MDLAAYQAALDGAAFYLHPAPGCLRLTGRDTAAFIQRQTTNDIRLLKEDNTLLTILTSPTARILDVFVLVKQVISEAGEDPPSCLAYCVGGKTAETARFLQKRIFFMDQLEVSDVSGGSTQIELFGPRVGMLFAQLGLSNLPTENQLARVTFDGESLLVLKPSPPVGLGYRLAISNTSSDNFSSTLVAGGARECDRETYECLRIETGIPGANTELREDYTPLEIGLGTAVSENKGCYTGQEVIARQINYEKITQTLCLIQLSAHLAAGTSLEADGHFAGRITSVAHSPRFGVIALGVLKRPNNAPGTILTTPGSPEVNRIVKTSFDLAA